MPNTPLFYYLFPLSDGAFKHLIIFLPIRIKTIVIGLLGIYTKID